MPLLRILDAADRGPLLAALRQSTFDADVEASVRETLRAVRDGGDAALLALSERFDGVRPDPLRVPAEALDAALEALDPDLRATIEAAAGNVRRFHTREMPASWTHDDGHGVAVGQRVSPVETAGLYVPGGTAPLPSSVVMNAVPALVAGVERVVVCSPPAGAAAGAATGLPHPLILAACRLLGLGEVYAVGGAQAVAAMAYGTETVPRVDVVVGPGNAYVATAKRLLVGQVGIDSVAGPSEVLVLADEHAHATHAAADLLAQAEHDARASALLVTPSRALAERVQQEVERLVPTLARGDVLRASLHARGAAVVTETMDEAVRIVDEVAPEHLVILSEHAEALWGRIRHAGAVFLGDASARARRRLLRRPEPRAPDRRHGALRLGVGRERLSAPSVRAPLLARAPRPNRRAHRPLRRGRRAGRARAGGEGKA